MEYRIIKGECSQFAVFEENYNSDDKEMALSVYLKFNYAPEGNVLRCCVGADMSRHDKPVVKAECCMYFGFSPTSVAEITRGKDIEIEKNILVQFASLCYGALRGILIDRSGDIPFAIPVLPPVYLQQMITEPYVYRPE